MPEWKYQPYQGIDPALLQQLVNAPSKSAAGINAFSQGAFGDANQHGALGSLEQMMQKRQQQNTLQQIMNYFRNSQQGNSGGSQGMPNPMMQAMGRQTTMTQDPLGIFGGQ